MGSQLVKHRYGNPEIGGLGPVSVNFSSFTPEAGFEKGGGQTNSNKSLF